MENWTVSVVVVVAGLVAAMVVLQLHVRYERDKEGRWSFFAEKRAAGKAQVGRFLEAIGRLFGGP